MRTSRNSHGYSVGDTLEIVVERIVPLGFGLGFGENLSVFVPLAVAGDRLRVQITQLKKRVAFAEITEILSPATDRIVAPCQYFGACGGCDLQQMHYRAQLDSKLAILKDCLRRIGKIDAGDITIVPSPEQFKYRSRAEWHVDSSNRRIGYFRRNSHEVIDVASCPILAQPLQDMLDATRRDLEWGKTWSPLFSIEAAAGNNGDSSVACDEFAAAAGEITFSTGTEKYFYSAATFFQGNQLLIPKLLELAVGGLSGEFALDLYCGVGLFSIPLSRHFGKVAAVEENPDAIKFGRKNAYVGASDNIEFHRASVDRFVFDEKLRSVDLIVFDPPRSGADIRTVKRLAELRPAMISYVSCDPSILARDLRILLDSGYRIDAITAIDLFPQNHHIETVVRLVAG